MSGESLALKDQWPEPPHPETQYVDPNEGFEDHLAHFATGLIILDRETVSAGDFRQGLVYASEIAGEPRRNGVLAIGHGGTNKTRGGDVMFGVDRRATVEQGDSAAKLFGFQSPIVFDERFAYVRGLLEKGLNGEDDDPVAYINELLNLENLGMFHDFVDAIHFMVSGKDVDITNLASYYTGNFPIPGFSRVTLPDQAFRSRLIGEQLTGDLTEEAAITLQGIVANRGSAMIPEAPILAKGPVRREFYNRVNRAYTYVGAPANSDGTPGRDIVAEYTVSLLRTLKDNGMISGIKISDGRFGAALINAARAGMLLVDVKSGIDSWRGATASANKREKVGEKDVIMPELRDYVRMYPRDIAPEDIARVAAFVVPAKVPGLNPRVAYGKMSEALGGEQPDKLDEGIVLRNIVARTAYSMLPEYTGKLSIPNANGVAAQLNEAYPRLVREHSYANVDAADRGLPDINKFVNEHVENVRKISEDEQEQAKEQVAKERQQSDGANASATNDKPERGDRSGRRFGRNRNS